MTSPSFDGRVALVTGAAGDLGESTARRLAASGALVALMDVREEPLAAIAESMASAGYRVLPLTVDQTERDQVDAAIGVIERDLGPVEALFANAGYGQFAPFLKISPRNWDRHISVNLTGTFNVSQSVALRMVAHRKPGAIVINASSAATVQCDQLASYAASKAGIRMLAMSMAAELGVHRIRVNTILPGVIESAMTQTMLDDHGHRDSLESETPLGRLGKPDDVAGLVHFLLSDDASFITGASIALDGGQTLHGQPRWFRLDYRNAHDEEWFIPA